MMTAIDARKLRAPARRISRWSEISRKCLQSDANFKFCARYLVFISDQDMQKPTAQKRASWPGAGPEPSRSRPACLADFLFSFFDSCRNPLVRLSRKFTPPDFRLSLLAVALFALPGVAMRALAPRSGGLQRPKPASTGKMQRCTQTTMIQRSPSSTLSHFALTSCALPCTG